MQAVSDFATALTSGQLTLQPLTYFVLNVVVSVVGVFPGPAATMATAAGVMYGVTAGVLLYTASATVGVVICYAVAGFLPKRITGNHPSWMRGLSSKFAESPLYMSVLLRLSPVVPFSVASFMLPLLKPPVVPYVVGSAIGLLPASFVYVHGGALGAELSSGASTSPVSIAVNVLALVASVVVGRAVMSGITSPDDTPQQHAGKSA